LQAAATLGLYRLGRAGAASETALPELSKSNHCILKRIAKSIAYRDFGISFVFA
jgi:hypothetical protein